MQGNVMYSFLIVNVLQIQSSYNRGDKILLKATRNRDLELFDNTGSL